MALRCPDYELVVIDMATLGPPAEEIVQATSPGLSYGQLADRAGRPGRVPQAGGADRRERPPHVAFSQPIDPKAARWQLGQITALTPREFVGFSERQELAVRALDCLAKLSGMSGELYDIRRVEDAVLAGFWPVPRLSGHAVEVLGNLGTQASQQALVDVASRFVNPLAIRRAAGVGLCRQRASLWPAFGPEGDRVPIRPVTSKSALRDLATQKVLASVLNTIESLGHAVDPGSGQERCCAGEARQPQAGGKAGESRP